MPPIASFSDRSRLEAHQLAQLRALLAEVAAGNPFYSRRLREAGVGPGISSLAEFFDRAPFTTKQELVEDQAGNPPFGTNLTYPLSRYTRFCQTSATTGKPMRWLDTPESWGWMLDCWTRVFEAAGVTAGDRVFFAFSFGPFLGFWLAFEAAARLGCLCIPGGGMRSAARVQAIIENGVTVLCCTPTYALRLAEAAAEEAIDLSAAKVRRIIVGGEPGGSIPGTRTRIENLWQGARVVDHHGMTEIGPVSYGCPRRPGVLHLMESAYIVEVIDPKTGTAAPAGGAGELVLTNLGRTGSPLLRYRTGDVVRRAADGVCECGTWDVALDGGILGRTDDMVVVRGVNVYPSAIEDVLRRCDGVMEYRVEVRAASTLPELHVQVEPSPDHEDAAALAQRIEGALTSALGLRVAVSSVSPGSLPRFEMKARRWVRL